jgi:hypothetical protein
VIGNNAVIEYRVEIGRGAAIGEGTTIRRGESLHWYSGLYHCDAYHHADGTPMFRHGCVTLPLVEWTPERQSKLCETHDPLAAETLRRAVRIATALFAEDQQ